MPLYRSVQTNQIFIPGMESSSQETIHGCPEHTLFYLFRATPKRGSGAFGHAKTLSTCRPAGGFLCCAELSCCSAQPSILLEALGIGSSARTLDVMSACWSGPLHALRRPYRLCMAFRGLGGIPLLGGWFKRVQGLSGLGVVWRRVCMRTASAGVGVGVSGSRWARPMGPDVPNRTAPPRGSPLP